MDPRTTIYSQYIRHVYSCWMSEHSYRTQSGQYIPDLNTAFCLAFMLSKIYSIVCARQLCLNCLEEVLGKGCSVSTWYVLTDA